jgi:hypothetical protein
MSLALAKVIDVPEYGYLGTILNESFTQYKDDLS